MNERKEIVDHDDIVLLVDAFYDKVLRDDILKPFFTHINFEHHKPKMIHFWSFVLLDEPGYTTNVFDKHAHMDLHDEHFARWLMLFEETIVEHFKGEKAATAILRAKTIGWSFKEKFNAKRERNG